MSSDPKYSEICDDKIMYMDYVCPWSHRLFSLPSQESLQKNLHKVTAPGKLIYVDDGEDALCSQDRTNV